MYESDALKIQAVCISRTRCRPIATCLVGLIGLIAGKLIGTCVTSPPVSISTVHCITICRVSAVVMYVESLRHWAFDGEIRVGCVCVWERERNKTLLLYTVELVIILLSHYTFCIKIFYLKYWYFKSKLSNLMNYRSVNMFICLTVGVELSFTLCFTKLVS
jgi:hypothetical protein